MAKSRPRRALMGRIFGAAAALVVVIGVASSFIPRPVPVQLGKVERRDLELTVDEPGRTRIRAKYVVSAPVSGQLERIALQAGDSVASGALVARIAPAAPELLDVRTRASAAARVAGARANLNRARSAVVRARTNVSYAHNQAQRSRTLHAEGGASQEELERSEFQARCADNDLATERLGADVALHELAAARVALASFGDAAASHTQLGVTAPVAGRVLRVLQQSEGRIQASTPLLEVGDPAALEIAVDVLTTDAVRIQLGASARIEAWGGDHPLSARVRRKEPSAYTTRSALGVEEQRVSVILDIVDPPERFLALGDGYRVEARIRVAKREQTLAVPASALFRDPDGWAAFALIRGAKAKKVGVRLGVRAPDWAEVEGGLALGDTVVEYPTDQVSDGVRVAEASRH
ncbi:MAG TPA: HlyD family efflux transporter periplasmic adaptor subunit [Polyangiales bacterium]